MALSIRQSVGAGGVNQQDDVKLIQVLLNTFTAWKSPFTKLKVGGRFGQGTDTIKAIKQFQREAMGRTNPDGRVDPGQETFRFLTMYIKPAHEAVIKKQVREGQMLAGAPVVSKTLIATLAGLFAQPVTYDPSISSERRIVNEYTLRVIKIALKQAGLKSAVITSTIRTPEIQADAMFTNCDTPGGLAYQRANVYKKEPATLVLDIFEDNRVKLKAGKSEVIKLMADFIREKQKEGLITSKHCVSKEAYLKCNVIDLGIPSLEANIGYDEEKFVSILKKLKAEGYISNVVPEPKNSCIHIEVIVNSKDLQKYEENTILQVLRVINPFASTG